MPRNYVRNVSYTRALAQDTTYVEIPVYMARKGESLEQKRARLVYQSRKRGIKETDLVLRYGTHCLIVKMLADFPPCWFCHIVLTGAVAT